VAVQTASEIRGSIVTGSELVPLSALPDPYGWCDLVEQRDATVSVVKSRISDRRTPMAARVISWPKETGGWRPMVWLDPIDQIVFRGVVGRLIPGIRRSIGHEVVSSLLANDPPKWRLKPWGAQTAERTRRGLDLLNDLPILGLIDVANFYPSVDLEALERVLGRMRLEPQGLGFLLEWLRQLADIYGAKGLPTGHDPSRLLADALLVGCDSTLSDMGIPFLRYVDDTWFFVRTVPEFDTAVTRYSQSLSGVGLSIQPNKTAWLTGEKAAHEIQNFAIAYIEDELRNPGEVGLDAALGLFEFALEDLPERKAELRRSLTAFKRHRHLRPLEVLRSDLELVRYAPDHWARYLRVLLSQKDTRRAIEDEWMVEQVTRHADEKTEMYKGLVFLRAMGRLQLDPELGGRIGDLISCSEKWQVPLRVGSAHVWGSSQAYRPPAAVERIEASGDYSTRRSLALTFDKRRNHPKTSTWLDGIRRVDADLEPTVKWLEN
jgi:hypothetical protein